jgi:AraC-like DNA-binding protein
MLANPRVRISVEQLDRMVRNGLRLTGDPALGLAFGQRITVSALGMVGYTAMAQATLGDALEIALKYQRLLLSHVELRARTDEGEAVLEVLPQLPAGPFEAFLCESVVACLVHVGTFLLARPLPGLRLRFAYPAPPHAERYHECFDCHLEFAAPTTELRWSAGALRSPLAYACEATARLSEEQCAAALTPNLAKDGVVRKVRSLLSEHDGRFPSVRALAKDLQTSERSLRRALSEQGTSYQVLLDEIRLRRAVDYLNSTTLPVEDIARNVGFGSSRSFRRAFRRWTGKSPSQLRAGQAA